MRKSIYCRWLILILAMAVLFGVGLVGVSSSYYHKGYVEGTDSVLSMVVETEYDPTIVKKALHEDLPTANWSIRASDLDPLDSESMYVIYAYDICQRYYHDVDPEVLHAIMFYESRFDSNAGRDSDYVGLTQISPYYNETRMGKLGVTDLTDPYGNLLVCADFLNELLEKYHDPALVLMLYSMRWDDAFSMYNDGQISDYARKVLNRAESYRNLRG